jgi:hypothetical protein
MYWNPPYFYANIHASDHKGTMKKLFFVKDKLFRRLLNNKQTFLRNFELTWFVHNPIVAKLKKKSLKLTSSTVILGPLIELLALLEPPHPHL